MSSPFDRIDDALGQYYRNCGRNDYYDANGIGKFKKFVNENELHENNIALELGDTVSVNDCCFIEMDDDFPFAEVENNQLFKDRFDYDINLHSLKIFFDSQEFDSEAIHNDIFPDNDGQSNIYHKMKDNLEKFYLFKDDILHKYSIKPVDEEESKTNSDELKIFKVLKHCYKFGRPPSQNTNNMPQKPKFIMPQKPNLLTDNSQKPNNELSPSISVININELINIDDILLDTNKSNPDIAENACLFIKQRQYDTDPNQIIACFNWLIKNAKQYEKIILHYDIMKDIPYFAFSDSEKPYVLDAMNWIYELVNLSGFETSHMESKNYKIRFNNNAKWKSFNLISIILHVISNIKDHTSPVTIQFITTGIKTLLTIDSKLNNLYQEWSCDEDIVQDWMKLLKKFDTEELLNKGITVLCIDLINNCIFEKDDLCDDNKDKLLDMGYLEKIGYYILEYSNVSDELKQKSMKSIEYFMDTPPYTIQKIMSKPGLLQTIIPGLYSKSSGLRLQTCKVLRQALYNCNIAQKTKFIEQYELIKRLTWLLENVHSISNETIREIVYMFGSLMDSKHEHAKNKIRNGGFKFLIEKLSNTDKITQEVIQDFLKDYYNHVPKIAMQPSKIASNRLQNINIPSKIDRRSQKSSNVYPKKPITNLPIGSESTIQSKMYHNFANDEDSAYDSQNDSQNDTLYID